MNFLVVVVVVISSSNLLTVRKCSTLRKMNGLARVSKLTTSRLLSQTESVSSSVLRTIYGVATIKHLTRCIFFVHRLSILTVEVRLCSGSLTEVEDTTPLLRTRVLSVP